MRPDELRSMSAWDVSTCCGSLRGKRELARLKQMSWARRADGVEGKYLLQEGRCCLLADRSLTSELWKLASLVLVESSRQLNSALCQTKTSTQHAILLNN